MLRFKYHIRDFGCAAVMLLFVALSTFCFLSGQSQPAYAEDGTPIKTYSDEFFVTIHDQSTYLTVKTSVATVAEVLERSGIVLAETDLVEPSLETTIRSDYNINIYRARPALIIDGIDHKYLMTASFDPRQIAREAGLTIYDGDTFSIEFNSNFLEAGAVSTYRVHRNGGRTLTLDEDLAYPTEIRYNDNLAKGEQYLEQLGEDGRRRLVYEVAFENNLEVSRTLISEEILAEPIPEIIVVGTKVSIPPEREGCASWAREAGVAESDLESALELMYRESGCRIDARNSGSGAYGIPQALPGDKMAAYGDNWETNPATQIRWMQDYVSTRYGGWQSALDFWWCLGTCYNNYGPVEKKSYWY